MLDLNLQIRRYLGEPRPGFWTWSNDGEAVLWADGTLLAFRMEVVDVLHTLAADGLPPLSAVLLVMAAAKKAWGDGQRAVSALSALSGELAVQRRIVPGPLVSEVLVGLASIHATRAQLEEDKAVLAELPSLFLADFYPRRDVDSSLAIIECLAGGPDESILAPRTGDEAFNDLIQTLAGLRDRLRHVAPDSIKLRARTGLDEVVRPAKEPPILEPASARGRKFIEQLRKDDEYAAIGRLARDFLAAIHLPRAVGDPDDMPLGGVSDISNRGHLDRLLVSELAHDDLTLSVRVATNEALYLRREDPPSLPARHRHLLIDAGVRMWGVPRVLAASLGLALAASADRDEVHAWSTDAGDITDAPILTRDGLIDHLARLDTPLTLTDQVDELSEIIGDDDADVVLITSEAALHDAAFLRKVRMLLPNRIYLAGIERDGQVRLVSVTASGIKPISLAHMNIDDVATVGEKKASLIDPNVDPELPAYLKLPRPPLLLPHAVDPRKVWKVDGGPTLAVANDGRLMLWRRTDRGALEIANVPPRSDLHWCNTRAGGTTHAVIGSLGKPRIEFFTIDLDDDATVDRVELELATREHIHGVGVYGSHVLVFYQTYIEALEMGSGRAVGHTSEELNIRSAHGRFAQLRDNQRCVAWFDGTRVMIEKWNNPVVAWFELAAFESGTVALMSDGRFCVPAKEADIRLPIAENSTVALVGVSRDQRRIAVEHVHAGIPQYTVFEPVPGNVYAHAATRSAILERLERDATSMVSPLSLRVHMDGVFAQRSEKNGRWELGLATRKASVVLAPRGGGSTLSLDSRPRRAGFIPFKKLAAPPGAGYTLRAASWPDGSRAVLDSRGLLHLQSSNRAVPEITLVLYDNWVSGWVSDGRVFGNPYFTDDAGEDCLAIYHEVIQAFLEELP